MLAIGLLYFVAGVYVGVVLGSGWDKWKDKIINKFGGEQNG